MLVNICMKFHEDILNGFKLQRTRFCDGQKTDGRKDRQTTQAKTIYLPTLMVGDITTLKELASSPYFSVMNVQLVDINVFAKF